MAKSIWELHEAAQYTEVGALLGSFFFFFARYFFSLSRHRHRLFRRNNAVKISFTLFQT